MASNTSIELVKADSPEQKVKCVVVPSVSSASASASVAVASKLKRGSGDKRGSVVGEDVSSVTSASVWWDPSTQDSPSRKPLITVTRGRRVSLLGRVLQHRQTSKYNASVASRPPDIIMADGEACTTSDPER